MSAKGLNAVSNGSKAAKSIKKSRAKTKPRVKPKAKLHHNIKARQTVKPKATAKSRPKAKPKVNSKAKLHHNLKAKKKSNAKATAKNKGKSSSSKKTSGAKFNNEDTLKEHHRKHGGEFKNAYSNKEEYLGGANTVMNKGTKVEYWYSPKKKDGRSGKKELRTGYVKFMGNNKKGKAKFEFVGTNLKGEITTYHVKRGEELYRLLNGSKKINVINPKK